MYSTIAPPFRSISVAAQRESESERILKERSLHMIKQLQNLFFGLVTAFPKLQQWKRRIRESLYKGNSTSTRESAGISSDAESDSNQSIADEGVDNQQNRQKKQKYQKTHLKCMANQVEDINFIMTEWKERPEQKPASSNEGAVHQRLQSTTSDPPTPPPKQRTPRPSYDSILVFLESGLGGQLESQGSGETSSRRRKSSTLDLPGSVASRRQSMLQ